MRMPDITLIQLISLLAAAIGMITGSIGLGLSIAAFTRDRTRVRLAIQSGMKAINAPEYDPTKFYVSVQVANIGRRPVHLRGPVFFAPGVKYHAILSDALRREPKTYAEGTAPQVFLVEEDEAKDFADYWPIARAYVYDTAGKTYFSKPHRKRPRWGTELSLWRTIWLKFSWLIWRYFPLIRRLDAEIDLSSK